MRAVYYFAAFALVFFAQVSTAHEYPTELPDRVSYGTRFFNTNETLAKVPESLSPSPCDAECPTCGPFTIPAGTADMLTAGVAGVFSWCPRNKFGACSTATCSAQTRICESNKTWVSSPGSTGSCVDIQEACDSEHVAVPVPMGAMSHRCIDIPGTCPEGEQVNHATGECEVYQGDCEPGEVWDQVVSSCVTDCGTEHDWNPQYDMCTPICQAGEVVQVWTIGDVQTATCAPDLTTPKPKDCQNILGYFNNKQICGDIRPGCESEGGNFIAVDGVEHCLSSDYDDDLPNCPPPGVIMITENGFECQLLEQPDEPPEEPETELPDIDDDGIPDSEDDDIDGDGIPNESDGDIDGDGELNEVDATPNGEPGSEEGPGEEDPREASGGSCEERPTCSGDAIDCAVLYQVWASRCEDGKAVLEGACGSEPTCEGDAVNCAIVRSDWRTKCAQQEGADLQETLSTFQSENGPSRIDQGNEELDALVGPIFEQPATSASCPSPISITLVGMDYNFSYEKFCDVAAQVRPVVLMAASIISFGILMRPF